MNCKKLFLVISLVLCSGVFGLKAQVTFDSGGGEATGYNGMISYSIGQILYTVDKDISSTLIKGVQQPCEVSMVKATDDFITLKCSIFPNPTIDLLTFKVDESGFEHLGVCLFDLNGTQLIRETITNRETHLKMNHLSPGIYYLRVIQEFAGISKEIKTFKVIKN